MKLLHDLWRDECGFVFSTELFLIATIVVVGLMAGFVVLRDTALGEVGDVAGAIGGLKQSYSYPGVTSSCGGAFTSGGTFRDRSEASNQQPGAPIPAAAITLSAVVPSPPAAAISIAVSEN